MEIFYTIKSVEISSRSIKGEKSSQTPNFTDREQYTFESIRAKAQEIQDAIIQAYGENFFQKLVVMITFSPVGKNILHRYRSGNDEEGKITTLTLNNEIQVNVI